MSRFEKFLRVHAKAEAALLFAVLSQPPVLALLHGSALAVAEAVLAALTPFVVGASPKNADK